MTDIHQVRRAVEMLLIASEFIRESGVAQLTAFYDGTECDGWCIADDCESAAEGLSDAIAKAEGKS